MFTCARTAGWSAHILEQKREGRLIRPTAKYVGPASPPAFGPDRLSDSRRTHLQAPGRTVSSGHQPHEPRTSARPRGAGRPHRSAVSSRVEPVRLARGSRGPRPGDVRPGPAKAPHAALRGRPRLPAARAAQHVLQPAAHGRHAGRRPSRCPTISTSSRTARRRSPSRGSNPRRCTPRSRSCPTTSATRWWRSTSSGSPTARRREALRVREATITTRLHRARQRVARSAAGGRRGLLVRDAIAHGLALAPIARQLRRPAPTTRPGAAARAGTGPSPRARRCGRRAAM